MADTRRLLSALQTLLADNVSADISPQDLRDFLVSSYPTVFNVMNHGAVGDGTTDDSSAIQSAIDACEAVGGGIVEFPPLVFAFSTGLVVDNNNVFLKGVGRLGYSNLYSEGYGGTQIAKYTTLIDDLGTTNDAKGTILLWTGSSGGGEIGLQFAPPVTGPTLHGCGMDGIFIDGAASLDNGVEILSNFGGNFVRIAVAECLIQAVHIGVRDDTGNAFTSVTTRNTQHCEFIDIMTISWLTATDAMKGILIDGQGDANVNFSNFGRMFMLYDNGDGLTINSADSLNFNMICGNATQAGTGKCIQINGGTLQIDTARKLHFNYIQTAAGGMTVSNGTFSPESIVIDHYSKGNASPDPVIGSKARVSWLQDDGLVQKVSGDASSTIMLHTNDKYISTEQNIVRNSARGLNDADSLLQYASWVAKIVDNTAGTEDGQFSVEVRVDGSTVATNLLVANGIKCGSPTGSFKGNGTINAEAVYEQGVLLITCYVLEAETTGTIDIPALDADVPDHIIPAVMDEDGKEVITPEQVVETQHEPARRFKLRMDRDMDPATYAEDWKAKGHLSAMPSREEWKAEGNPSLGDLAQRLIETCEVQAVHINKLLVRIEALEAIA